MKNRNIGLCILFSIITCGIYAIYWFIQINNNINELANPEKKTSGAMAFFLSIITIGIYGIYWAYKMGNLLDEAKIQRSEQPQNRAVVYLILQLIGFGWIGWILMQSTINSMIVKQRG